MAARQGGGGLPLSPPQAGGGARLQKPGAAGASAEGGTTSSSSPRGTASGRGHSPRPPRQNVPTSSKSGVPGRDGEKKRKLLDEYEVGATLGEGAFGVVRACFHKSTGKEFAVKMVDKVETPAPSIMREAEMLKSLNHANVVKCHDVFNERCFVCIVMDVYKGGDLVDGLQRHGAFECDKITHISHQIAAGINYLHEHSVAHRDVKGDNFMMDRRDMLDTKTIVVLTDFGTAAKHKEGEFFSAQVGTRQFWAPELLDKKYGLKVDIWAMGVLQYGLVTGRFPFKDENDIRKKEIKIRTKVDPVCKNLVMGMLKKREEERLDSKAVLSHPWLGSIAATADLGNEEVPAEASQQPNIPKMAREDGANVAIRDRRDELVERLQKDHDKGNQAVGSASVRPNFNLDFRPFVVSSKLHTGVRLGYEWWNPEKIKNASVLDVLHHAKSAPSGFFHQTQDVSLFGRMLEEHDIDTSKFGIGAAKSLENLAKEVRSGEARLMLDATSHKKIVRVVDIIVLQLFTGEDQQHFCVEMALMPSQGNQMETKRLPACIKAPHENNRDSAERLLTTMNLKAEQAHLYMDRAVKGEEECESLSYPGVHTVYNKEIVQGMLVVERLSAEELSKVGLLATGLPASSSAWSSPDPREGTKFHEWMTEEVADSRNVQYKVKESGDISALVHAPVGMDEASLKRRLESNGVDISLFGQGSAKSLRDFSEELHKGEASLMDRDGQLVRTVNVVIIILRETSTGLLLVQTHQVAGNGARKDSVRLPGGKCRPDENHFMCANRVVRRELAIDENNVRFNENVKFMEEESESPSYPGIKTIYKKSFISAELL